MEDGSGRRRKPKVVVVMGATGSGKSKLAIDLASHFPVEIINADSMQVYQGLDVLTNKVPLHDQKGVPHHLLGTISPNVEFTAKDFRDSAIPLIDDILSRNCIPVIVGGTNYYIQALVSPFLLDESTEEMGENYVNGLNADEPVEPECEHGGENFNYSYDCLKDLDPDAANRIHPNNNRKINQYLGVYARSGVLPSKLLQGKAMEGRTGVELIISDIVAVLYVWMYLSLYWTSMWNTGWIAWLMLVCLVKFMTFTAWMRTILEGYDRLLVFENLRIFLGFTFPTAGMVKRMI